MKGDVRWGEIAKKEGQSVELVGNQKPGLKHLPRAREGERGGSKENIRRVATAREARGRVGMSGLFSGRRSEGMTQSNISSLRGSELPFEPQRG